MDYWGLEASLRYTMRLSQKNPKFIPSPVPCYFSSCPPELGWNLESGAHRVALWPESLFPLVRTELRRFPGPEVLTVTGEFGGRAPQSEPITHQDQVPRISLWASDISKKHDVFKR